MTYDEVISALFFYQVRVREVKGESVLFVKAGDAPLIPPLRQAIAANKIELIKYFSQPALYQDKLDEFLTKAEAADKSGEDSHDYWISYYQYLGLRSGNYTRPWASVPEDYHRCPTCPYLGKSADADGIICDKKCTVL